MLSYLVATSIKQYLFNRIMSTSGVTRRTRRKVVVEVEKDNTIPPMDDCVNPGINKTTASKTGKVLPRTQAKKEPKLKLKAVVDVSPDSDPSNPVALNDKPKSKTRSKKTKTSTSTAVDTINSKKSKWVPTNWRKSLQFIRTMRAEGGAPVDTMGCERTMEEDVEPKVRRYQALVSLMLSSQTKDQVTFAAMERLKAHGLTVQSILDLDESMLGQLIFPVGFWKKKSTYIKKATQILRDKYDDDIPDTIDGLCSLPGVGQKMAYIAMSVAFGKNVGIGVDTHVHRISNRLKWTGPKETNTPEKTRLAIESWLPEALWPEFNILLVGFGQTVCLPINPKCASCLVNQHCPYGQAELAGKNERSN